MLGAESSRIMISEQRENPDRLPGKGWEETFAAAGPTENDPLLSAPFPKTNSTLKNGSGGGMITLSATTGEIFAQPWVSLNRLPFFSLQFTATMWHNVGTPEEVSRSQLACEDLLTGD